ncbi:MAG: hypothetical protein KF681_11380 [Bdellovibrionaceae bacterium]|nr:hypothetical protein [Pseudobdellovibrionaceae bacterium]
MKITARKVEPNLCVFFTKRGFSTPPKEFRSKATNSFKKRWSSKPYSFLVEHIDQVVWSIGLHGRGASLDRPVLLMDIENLIEMITAPPPPGGLYGKSRNSKKEIGKNVYSKRMQISKMRKINDLLGDLKFQKSDQEWLGRQWMVDMIALEETMASLIEQADNLAQEYSKKMVEGSNSARRLILTFGGKKAVFVDFAEALTKDLRHHGLQTFNTDKLKSKKLNSRLHYSDPKEWSWWDWI